MSPVGARLPRSADRGGGRPLASSGEEVLKLVTDIANRGVEWRNAESQRLADRAAHRINGSQCGAQHWCGACRKRNDRRMGFSDC